MRKKAGLFVLLCTPLLLEAMSLSEFKNALFAIFTSGAMFAEGARVAPSLSQARSEEVQQKTHDAAEKRWEQWKSEQVLGQILDIELRGAHLSASGHNSEGLELEDFSNSSSNK